MSKKNNSTDEQLIKESLAGSKTAYSQLIQKYQQNVRCFIASRCKYSNDVDDLAQETFIIAFQKLASLEEQQYVKSWLCGIALNLVRNHHRKFNPINSSNEEALNNLISEQLENQVTLSTEMMSISALQSCIKDLAPEAKTLMNLHYQQGLTVKALAEKLNLKHSTLTMRLHRIRALLHQCISEKLARDNHD